MLNTKMTFALLALVTGLAGTAPTAQAGEGAYMLGHSTFEDRCDRNGGDFSPYGDAYSCELEDVRIDCLFTGADSFCDWDGPQNMRVVSRVLGAALANSIADGGSAGKKKKYGKDFQLDLPMQWKP